MTSRPARITFNEAVRCARIVGCTIQHIPPDRLKAKPILFKPRGQILSAISAPAAASAAPAMALMGLGTTINGWYIDVNMRLYYENQERQVHRTTPIVSIDGNIVTTNSGSIYKLGTVDILIAKHIGNITISDSTPLEEDAIPILVNAAHDVYPIILEKNI
jgi:hypothetical protein